MESNVRKVQNVQLQILKDYMAFCKEHHLRYFVSGGSLIGVMRHKGFIPVSYTHLTLPTIYSV